MLFALINQLGRLEDFQEPSEAEHSLKYRYAHSATLTRLSIRRMCAFVLGTYRGRDVPSI